MLLVYRTCEIFTCLERKFCASLAQKGVKVKKHSGLFRFVVGLTLAIAALLFTAQSAPQAHAQALTTSNYASPLTQQSTMGSTCSHLMVYLHGSKPHTQKCLDQISASGKVSPNTGTTQCSFSALELIEWQLVISPFAFLARGRQT